MSDACLVTSVPSDAHGDADVGAFDRGRVVHAVAGHRDDCAVRLPRADDAELVLGRDAGIDGDSGELAGQVRRRSILSSSLARDGTLSLRRDAEFARDRQRGVRVVARNHHHANAGGAARRDGLLRFGARRVIHARQADEDQFALHFLGDLIRAWRLCVQSR